MNIKTMKVTAEQLEALQEVNRIAALEVAEKDAEIAELKAEIDDYKSLLLEAHRIFMKGRKLSTTPTEVLNWSARLSVLAKHKGG